MRGRTVKSSYNTNAQKGRGYSKTIAPQPYQEIKAETTPFDPKTIAEKLKNIVAEIPKDGINYTSLEPYRLSIKITQENFSALFYLLWTANCYNTVKDNEIKIKSLRDDIYITNKLLLGDRNAGHTYPYASNAPIVHNKTLNNLTNKSNEKLTSEQAEKSLEELKNTKNIIKILDKISEVFSSLRFPERQITGEFVLSASYNKQEQDRNNTQRDLDTFSAAGSVAARSFTPSNIQSLINSSHNATFLDSHAGTVDTAMTHTKTLPHNPESIHLGMDEIMSQIKDQKTIYQISENTLIAVNKDNFYSLFCLLWTSQCYKVAENKEILAEFLSVIHGINREPMNHENYPYKDNPYVIHGKTFSNLEEPYKGLAAEQAREAISFIRKKFQEGRNFSEIVNSIFENINFEFIGQETVIKKEFISSNQYVNKQKRSNPNYEKPQSSLTEANIGNIEETSLDEKMKLLDQEKIEKEKADRVAAEAKREEDGAAREKLLSEERSSFSNAEIGLRRGISEEEQAARRKIIQTRQNEHNIIQLSHKKEQLIAEEDINSKRVKRSEKEAWERILSRANKGFAEAQQNNLFNTEKDIRRQYKLAEETQCQMLHNQIQALNLVSREKIERQAILPQEVADRRNLQAYHLNKLDEIRKKIKAELTRKTRIRNMSLLGSLAAIAGISAAYRYFYDQNEATLVTSEALNTKLKEVQESPSVIQAHDDGLVLKQQKIARNQAKVDKVITFMNKARSNEEFDRIFEELKKFKFKHLIQALERKTLSNDKMGTIISYGVIEFLDGRITKKEWNELPTQIIGDVAEYYPGIVVNILLLWQYGKIDKEYVDKCLSHNSIRNAAMIEPDASKVLSILLHRGIIDSKILNEYLHSDPEPKKQKVQWTYIASNQKKQKNSDRTR